MTTFKELIASSLLASCQETTILMSNKLKDSEKLAKENEEKYKRYKEAWDIIRGQWAVDAARVMFRAMAKLTNDPLMFKFAESQEVDISSVAYDPFTVLFLQHKSSNFVKTLTNNKPYIVVNGKELKLLSDIGSYNDNSLKVGIEKGWYRLATPGEIQQCITELNDAQWKTIMTDDLFASIVNEALNTPVKLGEGDQINIESDEPEIEPPDEFGKDTP